MIDHYSTKSLAPKDRFAYWADVISSLHCVSDSETSQSGHFDAQLAIHSVGCIRVSEITSAALSYKRNSRNLSEAPSDSYLFAYLTEGEGNLEQGGRRVAQKPGEMVLYDTARNFTFDFPGDYRMIVMNIPRKQLLCRLPEAERMTAMKLESSSMMGSLLSSMILSSVDLIVPENLSAGAKVSSSFIDILAATMECEFGDTKGLGNRHSDLLAKTKNYMLANIDDPEMDMEAISSVLGASSRTISRLFAAEGTTAMQWLWQQRLAMSYTALTEGRARQIAEVAVSNGFCNFSHFSRAFKKQYGVPPSTLVRKQK
ncbi:helix-turn-helix domain-containing protein [Pseudomonas corrugata]|uniref:AraC-like ligand-binding domain-containing protein n=1 Tax=Pseudomonas corrugata TaxID=47879 RepID=UPI0006D8945D|nr:helix-turn-helix domain-containing protein [Pseudomonas corrugata]